MNLPYHIAAHFVYTGETIVKNGIISFTPQGIVSGIEAWGKGAAEMARTRFFSGLVLPSMNLSENKGIKLSEVQNLTLEDFTNLTLINSSGLLFNDIVFHIAQIQQRFALSGENFLHFWNLLRKKEESDTATEMIVKAGSIDSFMQLFGVEPYSWNFTSKTILKRIPEK